MAIENAYRTMPVADVPAGAYYASGRIAATVSSLPDRSIWWLVNGEWLAVGMPHDPKLVEVKVDERADTVTVLTGPHLAYV